MESRRYDYLPINRRKELKWPNGARVAFWVGPNIECFHIDQKIPSATSPHLPDVQNYPSREYGSRIGVFRLMDAFDKYGKQGKNGFNSTRVLSFFKTAEVCFSFKQGRYGSHLKIGECISFKHSPRCFHSNIGEMVFIKTFEV